MYFEEVGTLPYEPPPSELKPFFRRKYATAFRYVRISAEKYARKDT